MAQNSQVTKRLLRGIAVAAGSAILAGVLWWSGLLSVLELRSWDARVGLAAGWSEPSEQVVLILVDQGSLDWVQEQYGVGWPWPRELYAPIVNFCSRAGVASLSVDVLYLDPSRYGVGDDRRFGSAIGELGSFAGAMFLSAEEGKTVQWPGDVPRPGIETSNLSAWLEGGNHGSLVYPRASFPISQVAQNAAMLANVQMAGDVDGIYRRLPLFNVFDGTVVPTLGVAGYLLGSDGAASLELSAQHVAVSGRRVPVDKDGRVILHYKGSRGLHTAYTAASILQSEAQVQGGEQPNVDPALLEGRQVLLGFSAPALKDLRPSPTNPAAPGVEINATLLDNLITGDFMRDMAPSLSILLFLLLAFAAAIAAAFLSGAVRSVLGYVIFLPLPFGLSLAAYAGGVWMPLVPLEIAVALSLVGTNLANYATEGRQKRYIKGAFSQYLSPAVIEQLITHPERLRLGGERRELSIFFSDLQGFTTISEGLTPEELTQLLNDYLSEMTDIIQSEGGTIDKFEGDAIIAFWNAPLEQQDHADRAVRAAIRCQTRLSELRPAFHERVGKELHMRIGMNSGPAVVGNMGSRTRFDYTMLGDAVNLAARLEGINKQFGTYTMISGAMRKAAGDSFPSRELSRVAVVGRAEPVTVYEPMLPEEYAARKPILDEFARALPLFYAGDFARAETLFETIAEQDPAARSYVRKCKTLREQAPEQWEGVWVMTEK